jgi:UDP-glucose 4-epimerase
MTKKRVIITGAAGFVGGQTMIYFRDQGHKVIGIDMIPLPDHLRRVPDIFLHEDYSSSYVLDYIKRENPYAIIHCAGTSLVGPSVMNPELYYNNNFVKTKRLVDTLIQSDIKTRFVFSSSSSVYGQPETCPVAEESIPNPLSPYGESKRMIELLLNSYHRAYGFDYVALRYFNVCGADPQGRHGQRPGATHIIARILESLRDDKKFTLNGTDYPTPDGTCVRDHVHVYDVARLHEMAMESNFQSGIYNVGLEHGASNLEIVQAAQRITGKTLTVVNSNRRPGDPTRLVGSTAKISAQAWKPQYDLDDMIQHAWTWYCR